MMWYGFGSWWMLIWMLLFWAGVIALIVWAIRAASDRPEPSRPQPHGQSRALEILEERYARGEIDREEFEERRRALERA